MVNRSLRDEPSGGPPELAIIDANEAALVLCREVRDRGQYGLDGGGIFRDGAVNCREERDRHAEVPRALQVASTSSCIGYTDATNSCCR
jgi:hypothetical protein